MRYAFGSSTWLAALHGMMAQRAALFAERSPGFSTSICEVYYDAPGEGEVPLRVVAWSCVSNSKGVDFEPDERDDVQFKVRADFATIAEIVVFDTDGDPNRRAELGAIVNAAKEAGKLTPLQGDVFAEPDGLSSAHDLLARLTSIES